MWNCTTVHRVLTIVHLLMDNTRGYIHYLTVYLGHVNLTNITVVKTIVEKCVTDVTLAHFNCFDSTGSHVGTGTAVREDG